MRPFLSVYTPTYKRPLMLRMCRASVSAQTSPTEHVIVRDLVGLGVGGMYADIPNHAHLPTGEYVMVLSDDNVLVDAEFAADLEREAIQHRLPDVIVFKGECGESVQPLHWEREPEIEKIDLSCFAVHWVVWKVHADCWGARYEGDFDFIHHLWEDGYRFHWWDRLAFRALKISHGAPE